MMNLFKLTTTLCLSLLISLPSAAETKTETIKIYSYHNHPPFVNAPGQGLTYDIAEQLNALAHGQYHFEVVILPRSRLNLVIKDWISGHCPAAQCDTSWVVPWVNPKWGFIKGERGGYRWQPLIDDANVIISTTRTPIDYQNSDSLRGMTFGGMRGHKYVGIDELATQGQITRIDGNHERDNLLKLMHGRIDATLLPRSTINHFLRSDSYIRQHADELHIASTPHQSYTRFAMMPEGRTDIGQLVAQIGTLAAAE